MPGWLWFGLGIAVLAQFAGHALQQRNASRPADLPPAPPAASLRLASFGEPEALARVAMLYLQSFDLGGANKRSYAELDYARLVGWLRAILGLAPQSAYPLFSAARIYAENPDETKSRQVLEFIYEAYLEAPNRRWPWLAHAALVAKHRLKDLPLARRYAGTLERLTTDPGVPLWARQMEIFILEDMNEREAARIMLGGLLESGAISDPAEVRFLARRLKALESGPDR